MNERMDKMESRQDTADKTMIEILLRLERLETRIDSGISFLKWTFSGGLVSFLATAVLIWRAVEAMAKTHG